MFDPTIYVEGNQELPAGLLIDRFGSEYGSFLAPADSPYAQRALPPSNLDTPTSAPTYPYNYHVYRVRPPIRALLSSSPKLQHLVIFNPTDLLYLNQVLKPFTVLSGPIAPWFGQPGQGTQYYSSSNIMTLKSGGFIEDVPTNTDAKRDELERAVAEQAQMRKRGVVLERDV